MGQGGVILVVAGEDEARRALSEDLRAAGFDGAEPVSSDAVATRTTEPAAIVVTGDDAPELVRMIADNPSRSNAALLAVVPAESAQSIEAALAAGADEVVASGAGIGMLAYRLGQLLGGGGGQRHPEDLETIHAALTRVHDLITEGGDDPDVLREVLEVASAHLGYQRGSIVAHVEGSEHAYLVAASDDASLAEYTLAIAEYPEVAEAMRQRQPIFIPNVLEHPLTRELGVVLKNTDVRSLAIFPVVWRRRPLGALVFRHAEPGLTESRDRVMAGNLLASMLAVHLRYSTVIERLHDQTRRISRASYEAERRLRTVEPLKEHFEASADGVCVLDEEGKILFVNRTAEDITGFAADAIVGMPLADLVPPHQREPLRNVIRGVLGGTNLAAFDLNLLTTAGAVLCVSVTTSTVLGKAGAVVLSFRDVTAQRALEAELRQTKDFLERLIDSAVDAVVAADMRGKILLFNPVAERVFEHSAEEVIGQKRIWELYPPGVAQQIMKMLRSTAYGGVGRLEEIRHEVRSKSGRRVPVNMTASIMYEEGREVATFGIFSDLRDRIQMEQRLLQTQQKLEEQERRAMVAHLAGAAAHELNQPLTSIMASAELMQKRGVEGAGQERSLSVISSEAERMADIVKKIGRITRYETKEYVGSASIMDLDRSTGAAESAASVLLPESRLPSDVEDEFVEEPTRQFDPSAIEQEKRRASESEVSDANSGNGESEGAEEEAGAAQAPLEAQITVRVRPSTVVGTKAKGKGKGKERDANSEDDELERSGRDEDGPRVA